MHRNKAGFLILLQYVLISWVAYFPKVVYSMIGILYATENEQKLEKEDDNSY